uniref:Uncharacterized protein n=1 Tax=Yoonia rhodophyticola TaxID=3137370 RepID=A0AAN0M6U7_9RHOB
MSAKFLISAGVALTVLAGCTEEDLILPGERFDLRAQAQEVNQVRAVSLTSPVQTRTGHTGTVMRII